MPAAHKHRYPWPAQDVARSTLIGLLYSGAASLPDDEADDVELDYELEGTPDGVEQVDRYTIANPGGRAVEDGDSQLYAFFMRPEATPNGRLLIVGCGHTASCTAYAPIVDLIEQAAARGYYQLVVEMPLGGHNPNPATLIQSGTPQTFTYGLGGYNHPFYYMDLDGGTPNDRLFLDPFVLGLNSALAEVPGLDVYAVGHSGGGRIVELLSAIDERVIGRHSIFGSLPLSIQPLASGTGHFDGEQNPDSAVTKNGGDCLRRYALSAMPVGGPRRPKRFGVNVYSDEDEEFVVLNKHAAVDAFAANVRKWSGGGDFTIHYDTASTSHSFAPATATWVLDDIDARQP